MWSTIWMTKNLFFDHTFYSWGHECSHMWCTHNKHASEKYVHQGNILWIIYYHNMDTGIVDHYVSLCAVPRFLSKELLAGRCWTHPFLLLGIFLLMSLQLTMIRKILGTLVTMWSRRRVLTFNMFVNTRCLFQVFRHLKHLYSSGLGLNLLSAVC